MLQLVGVSKTYGGVRALHAVDLTIPVGRTTVLIGPSGCGKSTLLRLMVGLVQPDSGHVLFDGATLTPDNAPGLRQQIGFVVQDGGLFPHLSAHGNISLMARLLGWRPPRIDERLRELLDLTRFPADRLDQYPAQLSGGQRQRVSLMRALMLDPQLILLDEPLGALDPLIRSELQTDLRGIFQTLHKTVVLVTHDLAEASFLGNHLVLLRGGRIVQQDCFAALLERPADEFVTRFINAQRPRAGCTPRGRSMLQGRCILWPLCLVGFVSAGCAPAPDASEAAAHPSVAVGSKAFTESVILGEILAQMAASTGAQVVHKDKLGDTGKAWNALLVGNLDAYCEYIGTLTQELFAREGVKSDADLIVALQKRGLRKSRSLGFSNGYALGMKEERAAELNIRTISDLRFIPSCGWD